MLKDHTDIGGSSPPASAANAKLTADSGRGLWEVTDLGQ